MAAIPKTIGRYDIVELVGRGGMGVLYRARDMTLERDVALKMMLVDFTFDAAARKRFEREARAVARLQHRNIVTIHELGDADGAPFIVMEFLSGKDLETMLRMATPLTLAAKLDIASQLCEGLAYAHEQGVVHRDIKPGNIRVLEDGTVKILDFGIAKFAVSSVTQSGAIIGTPSYMAPEQIMGQPVDGRADLFSVGVVLYELLCGKKPFSGDSPTAVVYQIVHEEPRAIRGAVADLPEAVEEIVAHALKKNADERYSHASEMAYDLQMVRMMLDLPLHTAAGGADATSVGMPSTATLKLHATAIKSKTGPVTALRNAPLRSRTLAPPPEAPPQTIAKSPVGRPVIWGASALVAVVVAVTLWIAFRGNAVTPAAASPSAAAGNEAAVKSPAGTSPATMFVSSVPSGARIILNGEDTQKITPAQVPMTGRFPAAIELSLPGYQSVSAAITEADVTRGSREFKLARDSGPVQLTISGPYAFELVQGSKVLSPAATHHVVTIQPGGAAIAARNNEYLLNSPVPIDFQRSQTSVTLPAPGTLAVFATNETCSIAVDGVDLGNPPIPRKPIAPGPHTVSLKCPDGKQDGQKIRVGAGERAQVTFGK